MGKGRSSWHGMAFISHGWITNVYKDDGVHKKKSSVHYILIWRCWAEFARYEGCWMRGIWRKDALHGARPPVRSSCANDPLATCPMVDIRMYICTFAQFTQCTWMQTGKGGRVDRCPHLQHDIYVMHIAHCAQCTRCYSLYSMWRGWISTDTRHHDHM